MSRIRTPCKGTTTKGKPCTRTVVGDYCHWHKTVITVVTDPDLIEKITRGEQRTFSMGCAIEEPICAICGSLPKECDHNAGTFTAGDVQFISASWVPAPKCETCDQSMKGASSSTWACANEGCAKHGEPVTTGAMPFWPLEVTDG